MFNQGDKVVEAGHDFVMEVVHSDENNGITSVTWPNNDGGDEYSDYDTGDLVLVPSSEPVMDIEIPEKIVFTKDEIERLENEIARDIRFLVDRTRDQGMDERINLRIKMSCYNNDVNVEFEAYVNHEETMCTDSLDKSLSVAVGRYFEKKMLNTKRVA